MVRLSLVLRRHANAELKRVNGPVARWRVEAVSSRKGVEVAADGVGELLAVLYRHHPWFGRRVFIHGTVDKDGFIVFRCTLEESQADRGLEVPAWMLQLNRMSASTHLRRSPRCSIWR
jgi:hypothetical protein